MNLLLFIFIIFFKLFICFIHSETYYASPNSNETNITLCISKETPCSFSTLINLDEDNLTIHLLENGSLPYEGHHIRMYASNQLILNASNQSLFHPQFSIWCKQSVSHLELNHFRFMDGIQSHQHNDDIQTYILYLDSINKTLTNIYLNHLYIPTGEYGTLIRLSENYSSQIYFDQVIVRFNPSSIIESSLLTSSFALLESTFESQIGPISNITIVNSELLDLQSSLYQKFNLRDLTIENCKIRYNNTPVFINAEKTSSALSVLSVLSDSSSTSEDQPSTIKIKNSFIEDIGNGLFISSNKELKRVEFENVTSIITGFNFFLNQIPLFPLSILNSTFISKYIPNYKIDNSLNSFIELKIKDTSFQIESIEDKSNSFMISSKGNINTDITNSIFKKIGVLLLTDRNNTLNVLNCTFDQNLEYGLSLLGDNGELAVYNTIFQNLKRGLKINYLSAAAAQLENVNSTVLIDNCIFRNIKNIMNYNNAKETFERYGGSLQIKAKFITVQYNTFENTEYLTTNLINNELISNIGTLGIYTFTEVYKININNNLFINTKSDYGGSIAIWTQEITEVENSVLIINNKFISNEAKIGSAIKINSLVINGLIIKNNLIQSNNILENASIFINSISTIKKLIIDSNIFSNNLKHSSSESNSNVLILIDGYYILNPIIKNNTFDSHDDILISGTRLSNITINHDSNLLNITSNFFNILFQNIDIKSNIKIEGVLKNNFDGQSIVMMNISALAPISIKNSRIEFYNSKIYNQLSLENADAQITDSIINSNGKVFVDESKFILQNSMLSNINRSLEDGGSLFIKNSNSTIRNSTFYNILAKNGGCVYTIGGILEIFNSTFDTCHASNIGGGIYFDNIQSIINLNKVIFRKCNANEIGGAIFIPYPNDNLMNASKNNDIKFDNCIGGYEDNIGSIPTKIKFIDEPSKSIDYPFDFRTKNLYALVQIETPYSILKPIYFDRLILSILKGESFNLKALNCPPNLKIKNSFCIQYSYSLFDSNEFYIYKIEFTNFLSGYDTLSIIGDLYIRGMIFPKLIYISLVSFIILILCIVTIIVSITCIFLIKKFKKRMHFADLELSLLRKRIDQDLKIDGEADLMSSNLNNIYQIKLSEVNIKEKIGSGGSGASVMRGIWKDEEIALKLFRGNLVEAMKQEFENEILLLSSLYHPNIVRFSGVINDPPRYGIATEYCPGSVSKLIRSGKSSELSFGNKLSILYETCSAMEYLVKREIIHRDLKWENVLMSEYGEVRLTDLGLSRRISEKTPQNLTARVGTSYLMAPEVVKGLPYDWKCDVFSFGIMIYELLSDKLNPFDSIIGIEFKIAQDSNCRPDLALLSLNQEDNWILAIIVQCWEEDPSLRPSFTDLKTNFYSKLDDKIERKKIKFMDSEIIISNNSLNDSLVKSNR